MSSIGIQPTLSNRGLSASFPSLQRPCPIVEGDRQRRQQYEQCKLPNAQSNCTYVDPRKVDVFVKQGEQALPYIADVLQHSNNEIQVTETLFILDKMLDNGTKGVDKMYPVLSRFNDTRSPNIQTYLAGIYRKTQVPDAFGPLVKMLVQNSLNPKTTPYFDPNEEIGGAILSYLSDRYKGKTGEFVALA